jgi:hypothetical protein
MATRLTGWEAIAFAERSGCLLGVHGDGREAPRDGVTVEEARRVARRQPERVFVDFDEPEGGGAAAA